LPNVQIPLVRQFLARRIVAVREGDGAPPGSSAWMLDELMRTLASAEDPVRIDILHGLKDAYRGRRTVAAPASWKTAYAALAKSESRHVREDANELGVVYGNRDLIARLQQSLFAQPRPGIESRRRALELLTARHEPSFGQSLLELLSDLELRPDVIRALAAYDLPEIPPRLINGYARFTAAERQD